MPRGDNQGFAVNGGAPLECPVTQRAVASHDGRVDLRAGASCAEPRTHGSQVLSRGSRVMNGQNGSHANELHKAPAGSFTLNGKAVDFHPNETILQAAQRHGVEIPRLCYMEGIRPDGNCRTCMVEI